MPDTYASFQDLRRSEAEGVDYAIRVIRSGSLVSIIAPHGGMIEPTTSEIALAIAGADYNCYLFEGLTNRRHGDLHITSSKFDEPQCLELVADCDYVVAIHGCVGNDVEFVEVGGRDRHLRDDVCIKLAAAGFEAAPATKFVGTHPSNICNRNRRGAGVQLEITRALRDALRDDAERMVRFAAAIRAALG